MPKRRDGWIEGNRVGGRMARGWMWCMTVMGNTHIRKEYTPTVVSIDIAKRSK